MKKILTLLLACTLFAACGDSDDPEPQKPYYNPVEGKWVDEPGDRSRNLFVFTKDFDQYIYTYTNNEVASKTTYGKYTITEKKLTFGSGNYVEYKVEKDTLYITYPKTGQVTKWIKTNEVLPY